MAPGKGDRSMKKVARGHWQESIYYSLKRGEKIVNPISQLQGKARKYSWRYDKSFKNLLSRMSAEGIIIKQKLGPRGGQWHAEYWRVFPEPSWETEVVRYSAAI